MIYMENNNYDHYLKYIPGVRFWIITTGVLIAFMALRDAKHIVNMILLASFLTAISLAPLSWLKKKGVPKSIANVIVILAVVLVVGLIGLVIGASATSFSDKLPVYQMKFEESWKNMILFLYDKGLIESKVAFADSFKSGRIMEFAAPVATGFGSLLSRFFVVFLFFVFMITEADIFVKKLNYISKDSSKEADHIVHQLRNYFGIKTITSFVTGVSVGLMLYIMGIDFPVLWGFMAFLLNYIPSIGSVIAAIPAVIIALIIHGPGSALIVGVAYLVLNTIIGNVIEPQLMGRNLGISPLIVFFSMIFFGFILGPVGMLIATPLTIIIKIILDSRDVTRGLGIMLGDGSDIEPKAK
jgi:predicted PurR-regulated permease PerM